MAETKYDLLLKGGHVIDPKSGIERGPRRRDRRREDRGRRRRRSTRVEAFKVVDVSGLYVTPGLVDMHVHVFAGTGEKGSYAGDNSLYPDGFTLRVGVTTVVDAGMLRLAELRGLQGPHHRPLDARASSPSSTSSATACAGAKYEQDLADMEAKPTAEMALRHKGLIVGIKTAHYAGPEWAPVERSVEAGTHRRHPGHGRLRRQQGRAAARRARHEEAPARRHLHSHVLGPARRADAGRATSNPGMVEGRKRGVIFDVGHGGGSFVWRVAVPAIKEGSCPTRSRPTCTSAA